MPERTLVALHGNFASSAWWAALTANPPTGWRVLAPDLPGFAGTPYTGEVSIPAYADWLSSWMQAQGTDRPALLGHSLGGAVALELVARRPGAVAGLILAASAPLSGLVTPEENYPVLELLRTNRGLREISLGALFPSGRPANFSELVEDGGRMSGSHYAGNARALAAWCVDGSRFSGVRTLVLGGLLDTLISPERVRAQAAALRTEAILLEGVGHGFPQEDPITFRGLVESFLGTLEPAENVTE